MESILDWEQPISEEELVAIEVALDSASLLFKRRKHCTNDDEVVQSNGRGLPNWETKQCSTINHNRRFRTSKLKGENNSIGSVNNISGSSYHGNLHLNLLFSSQVDLKVRYPTMKFGGRIIYSRTVLEVQKATTELLEFIEAKKDQVILGLDIEWKPSFVRGATQGKAAVMQICGDADHCYVMHIIHSGIPPVLRSLLKDPTYIKVGVGIANDATKVLKDCDVCIKALEELSDLANLKLGGKPKKWSLRSLTETLTCKQLEKPNNVRLGNWEADVLSKMQLQYAALDAFVSWHLYQILTSLPDPANAENVEDSGLKS